MSNEAVGEPPVFDAYRVQDTKYGRHVFRPGRLAIACILLCFAAIFGWVRVPEPAWINFFFGSFFLYAALMILILALLAAFREEPGFAYVGALLGLLFLFPSVGTVLSALALVALRRVETSEPLMANV